jgi:hypothetical protein
MTDLSSWLFPGEQMRAPLDLSVVLLSLGIAFLGGQTFAWVYLATHSGRSAPRSLVNTVVVLPVLVALMMLVLQDNLVTAFGMMSIFAIVRFRNVLSETHDTTYVFAAIMLGVAAGTQHFSIALVGCLSVSAILFYLSLVSFDRRITHDLVLHLHWTRPPAELPVLNALISRHGRNTECTSFRSREAGGCDLSYLLLLRDPSGVERMLAELNALEGVQRVNTFKGQDELKG